MKANSVVRAKNKVNADQVILWFELTKFQPSSFKALLSAKLAYPAETEGLS